MNNIGFILFFLSLSLFLPSCTSITTGTNQSISVESFPKKAECKLTNDKGTWYVSETPGSLVVHRSYSPLTVFCTKGKLSGVQTVESSTKGMAFGNIVFGGIIGAGVDMANGSAYDYPPLITVKLEE